MVSFESGEFRASIYKNVVFENEHKGSAMRQAVARSRRRGGLAGRRSSQPASGLESYASPDNGRVIGGAHLGMSLDVMLFEIDERFNYLKRLMGSVPAGKGDAWFGQLVGV